MVERKTPRQYPLHEDTQHDIQATPPRTKVLGGDPIGYRNYFGGDLRIAHVARAD
jgi:hypothetical protein